MAEIISRIYTRNGDAGKTDIGGGKKVEKSSDIIEFFGDMDELSAVLGLAKIEAKTCLKADLKTELKSTKIQEVVAKIEQIQKELIQISAELVNSQRAKKFDAEKISRLENDIDSAKLPPLTEFIIPGTSKLSAILHFARTVSRRAERHLVKMTSKSSDGLAREFTEISPEIFAYLNRLSDWLFVLARIYS